MPDTILPLSVPIAKEIVDVNVVEEMQGSYNPYVFSVITNRAIPDIRDGLKPVQRRLLYAMLKMGANPSSPHKKSARVVGETMGKYHPHGDASIYDALVRMGQPFARFFCFVDPQGNFGSLDDPPAASRYTECRLSDKGLLMLDGLGESSVEFSTAYDGEGTEPVCMPARLPALICNGSSGIAVGMSTTVLPHNPGEVLETCITLLDMLPMPKRISKKTPPITQQVFGMPPKELLELPVDALDAVTPSAYITPPNVETFLTEEMSAKLLDSLPAPDFPSGGHIQNTSELSEAFSKGKGVIRVRAKISVEKEGRKKFLIVSELPHLVGPEKIVSQIKKLVQDDKLPEVSGVYDFSDRKNGMRIQIDITSKTKPENVIKSMWKHTLLESSYHINNVVLSNGKPITASTPTLLTQWLYHRLETTARQTFHRRKEDLKRQHILEGYLMAIGNIDNVIKVCRSRLTDRVKVEQLQTKIGVTKTQAEHILDMQLKRIGELDAEKLEKDISTLKRRIRKSGVILGSDKGLKQEIREQLKADSLEHAVPRKALLV